MFEGKIALKLNRALDSSIASAFDGRYIGKMGSAVSISTSPVYWTFTRVASNTNRYTIGDANEFWVVTSPQPVSLASTGHEFVIEYSSNGSSWSPMNAPPTAQTVDLSGYYVLNSDTNPVQFKKMRTSAGRDIYSIDSGSTTVSYTSGTGAIAVGNQTARRAPNGNITAGSDTYTFLSKNKVFALTGNNGSVSCQTYIGYGWEKDRMKDMSRSACIRSVKASDKSEVPCNTVGGTSMVCYVAEQAPSGFRTALPAGVKPVVELGLVSEKNDMLDAQNFVDPQAKWVWDDSEASLSAPLYNDASPMKFYVEYQHDSQFIDKLSLFVATNKSVSVTLNGISLGSRAKGAMSPFEFCASGCASHALQVGRNLFVFSVTNNANSPAGFAFALRSGSGTQRTILLSDSSTTYA